MKTLYKIFILFLVTSGATYATHLLGGEIRATHVAGQTFKIAVHLYFESGNTASNNTLEVPVCFGDGGTANLPRVSFTSSPDGKYSIGIFEKNYTYPSSGTFQVAATISNRSGGFLNLPNSELQPLFLWTVISTQLANTTPTFGYPKLQAGTKQTFIIDLKPSITDNDSVSIHLQNVAKPSPGTCGVRSLDYSYFYPNDLTKSGTFKVDNQSKKLIWNAPTRAGKYIYAFVADEWRDGIIISQSYHEGTVVVSDLPGDTVEVPAYEPAGELVTSVPGGTVSSEISISMDAYPVPTTDYLTFRVYSKTRSLMNVQLVNLQGQVVREINSASAGILFENQFDVRLLHNGVYLLRAKNDRESVVLKVIR